MTMLLNIQGKKNKVELFEKSLFETNVSFSDAKRFRMRVNGKFFPEGKKSITQNGNLEIFYFVQSQFNKNLFL